MEAKFAHIILFFLLAFSFETLMARKESDGPEVIKLLKEFESESWCKAFDTLMARKESDRSEVINLKKLESEPFCKGKQFWPELIGVPTKLAKKIIEKENPCINDVPIVLSGTPIPLDYRFNRVRLVDNILGDVVVIPMVG